MIRSIYHRTYKSSALIVTLIILAIVLTTSLSLALISINERRGSVGSAKTGIAYQTADEGVERVNFVLKKESLDKVGDIQNYLTCHNGWIVGDGYEVRLEDENGDQIDCADSSRPASDIKNIKSIGTLDEKSQRSIEVPVSIMPCNQPNSDSDNKLLLHMDGGSDGSSFIDSSAADHSVANKGNVSISRDQKVFCKTGYFDGSIPSYLSIPDSNDWWLEGNYTVDFWMYPTSISQNWGGIVTQAAGYYLFSIELDKATLRAFGMYTDCSSNNSNCYYIPYKQYVGIQANKWYHIAYVRKGNESYLFVNGVASNDRNGASATGTALPWPSAQGGIAGPLIIGCRGSCTTANYHFKGYLDEVRLSKGIARWTSDFTPPTRPY